MLKEDIAGVVVFYNPTEDVKNSIKSYINCLSHLYIIDNSEIADLDLIKSLKSDNKNVSYHSFSENVGIAKALNQACKMALKDGFKWILTMDQDSVFYEESLSNLYQSLQLAPVIDTGIITPDHVTAITVKRHTTVPGITLVTIRNCMTSGNLLNLSIWEMAGQFKEDFFIDFVDHEYCLRLNKLGYKIFKCPQAILTHQLGNGLLFKWLGLQLSVTNHNYLRRYYMTRNRLWCIKNYIYTDTKICLREVYSIFAELFKIILKEKNKYKKLRSMYYGLKDFCFGNFGKYNHS